MADNTTFSPGSGATLATDEISSVHHVYNKMEWGADGTATPIAIGASALPIQDGGNSITVDGTVAFSNSTIAVTNAGTFAVQAVCTNAGTFAVQAAQSGTWNITNVSGTISLPTGASTAAKQPALGTAGTASSDVITVQGIASMTALKVDGSAVTQPVSAASLPLPSGAATAAKQPALGTAGSASADVITVQGVTSMTALKVDGSAVTQPVSGTVAFSNTTVAVTNAGTFATQSVCTNAGTFAVQATVAAGATTIGKAEDVASADADVGVPAMAVRKATPANTSDTDGDYEMLQMSAGRLWTSAVIDTALPAGTNAIGKLASNTGVTIGAVEIAATQTLATVTTVGTVTTITNAVTANLAPTTTGGCSMSSTLSSASSNTATSVKGSAGQLYGIYVSNTNASARWLKLYNTSSTPTGGSGTPVLRLLIPGNTSGVAGAFEFSNGVAFSSGIGFTITGAVADNDTTAISANEVIVNILYK